MWQQNAKEDCTSEEELWRLIEDDNDEDLSSDSDGDPKDKAWVPDKDGSSLDSDGETPNQESFIEVDISAPGPTVPEATATELDVVDDQASVERRNTEQHPKRKKETYIDRKNKRNARQKYTAKEKQKVVPAKELKEFSCKCKFKYETIDQDARKAILESFWLLGKDKEFQLVKENLLSDDYEKRRIGLDLISAWRARASVLPAGAETSSYLVAALDMDVAEYGDLAKMSVATAIVRFINLVTHLGQTGPYHQVLADVATSMNVPDWIVGLRHDITHGHMPSLESLIAGAKEAMIWLKSNYWEIEETRVRDWVFVKEFSKKRKRKKQSERTWKNFKAFYDLHESIDLYFFLIVSGLSSDLILPFSPTTK
ncbi:hypothetical protein QYM36_010637, partial [Artemia franciscana]